MTALSLILRHRHTPVAVAAQSQDTGLAAPELRDHPRNGSGAGYQAGYWRQTTARERTRQRHAARRAKLEAHSA